MKQAASVFFIGVLLCGGIAHAVETRVVVTARARDAKFIGTSMGGALVVIRDSATGELLKKGMIAGETGSTKKMLQEPLKRGEALSDAVSAKFETVLDLEEPRLVTIEVQAPYGQKQSMIKAATQAWLIPGKDMAGAGDGIMLEIPGFSVDVLAPQAHEKMQLQNGAARIDIRANVMLMCGCPVEPGGVWDAKNYEVTALVKRNGAALMGVPMRYAGKISTFAGSFDAVDPGFYEICVYAYAPQTGNTGVDTTTIVVQ
ncbi:MAG: hypothetical protein JW832_05190 [Deltaproteobacteria bacterium]|nr:hypothetical protein [Deltaproteobacteria bacterium]